MREHIDKAIEIINQGGVVIFPTDTAFGIGCRMDDHHAIQRVFEIRNRPLTQPTPILVAHKEMAKQYIENLDSDVEKKLIDLYWPGALTIIVPAKRDIDSLLQKNGGIGLRMPNHEITQALISGVGVGILGPSANFHGAKTPYKLSDLDDALINKVDFVLKGECSIGKESTVISTLEKPWTIVRQGAVEVLV